MPRGIPLTEAEQNRRRQEIFDASVHLFLEHGFNETSMREIAKAAKMGKSTLYGYFETKEDILVSYFEREYQQMTAVAQEITLENLPASEKLRRIMHLSLAAILANQNAHLRLTFEAQRLSLDSQQRLGFSRHTYQDVLRDLLEQGVRAGAFRPIDTLMTTRILLMLVTPVVFTTRPTGTPQQMLDEALEIFFRGIQGLTS